MFSNEIPLGLKIIAKKLKGLLVSNLPGNFTTKGADTSNWVQLQSTAVTNSSNTGHGIPLLF